MEEYNTLRNKKIKFRAMMDCWKRLKKLQDDHPIFLDDPMVSSLQAQVDENLRSLLYDNSEEN